MKQLPILQKSKKTEAGFTTVEASLILLVLAVVGFGGYYVWHTQHSSQTVVTTPPQTITSDTKTTSVAPAVISGQAATDLVTSFYNQYIAASNTTSDDQASQMKQVVERYGTTNLVDYAYPSSGGYASDPIVCAQEYPPSFSVKNTAVTTNTAAGTVTEHFDTDFAINYTLVKQSGALKIDSIACNPPLTPQEGSN